MGILVDDAEKLVDDAEKLIDKDPGKARAMLEKAGLLDAHPQGNWKIHWLMARSYLKELPYAATKGDRKELPYAATKDGRKELPNAATKDGRKGLLDGAYDQMTKALSSCRDADKDEKDRQNKIKCLAFIGWICLLKKDYSGAISHLLVAKASENSTDFKPCISFLLGLAYLKYKLYDQSNSEFDELLNFPHHDVFRWNNIPGLHDGRLKDFLITQFGDDWKDTNKIEKTDNGGTIKVSAKESISLSRGEDEVEIKEKNLKLKAKKENSDTIIYLKPLDQSLVGKNALECFSEICLDPEEFKIDSYGLLHIYTDIYKLFSDLERYVNIEDTGTCLDKINTDINKIDGSDKKVKSYLEHCWGWWYLNKCILEDKPYVDLGIINASISDLSIIDKIVIIGGELTDFRNLEISCNGTVILKNANIQNFKIQDLRVKGKERHLLAEIEEATIEKAQVEYIQYYCDKSDQKELCTFFKHMMLEHTVLRNVKFNKDSIKGIKIQHESMITLAIEHLQRSLGLLADHYAYLHLAQAYELQMMWEKDEVKKAIIKKRAMDACQRCIDLDHYEEHNIEAQDLKKRLEGSQSASSPPQQAKKEEDKAKGEGAEKAGLTASSEVKKTGG